MRISVFLPVLFLIMTSFAESQAQAQGPPQRRPGGFVPGQQRRPEDPAQLARGKTLYGIGCRGCHGADLRGGDMGGPNLLRSQLALSDKDGELIVPVIQGSRQSTGMPAIPMPPEDAKAVAAYVRSIMATIGRQGSPPGLGKEAPSILVGNASEGQAYFSAKCGSCHSATGDLKGIAARITDPKVLQNTWITGGGQRRFGQPAAAASNRRTIIATVTLEGGRKEQGKLLRIDDFLVTLEREDGTISSFRRDGDSPKVDVNDPMQEHRDMLAKYSDKDIHDVTSYLVTLK